MAPTKQPPQRTCVACRATSGKRELIRLVRTADRVEIDLTGKKAGRGAYVCREAACWETALKKGRLDAALRTKVAPADRQRLADFAAALREAVAV